MRYALGLLLPLLLTGCTKPNEPGPRSPTQMELPAERPRIGSSEFGRSAKQVLDKPVTSPAELGVLVGVVQHQLRRAEGMFHSGYGEHGLRALFGAFYLVSQGDFRPEMLAEASRPLGRAAALVARLGREGQALALYSLLAELGPNEHKRDAVEHLAALKHWSDIAAGQGPLQAAGDRQRVAAERAIVEPTETALQTAEQATLDWIRKALEYRDDQQAPSSPADRDEAIEAFRAIRSGAIALAALHLRHGDALAALQVLDEQDISQVVSPNLRDQLKAAAETDEPEAWATLFTLFESIESHEPDSTGIDPALATGAAFGTAIALYRREPDNLRAAVPLASLLLRHEMSEVAVLILEQSLGATPKPEELSFAAEYLAQAINRAAEINDIAAVRRIFANAQRILELSRGEAYRGKVKPAPEEIDLLAGAIEARNGHLGEARVHLLSAIKVSPTADALSLLAAIERQRGDAVNALKSLEGVIALNRRQNDAVAEAEARLLQYEIQRDAGHGPEAQSELESALKIALTAREQAQTLREQAEVERVLARVLEHYGEFRGANRAAERAFEASRGSSRQLTATILDSSRRALTLGDVGLAREALRRGLEEDLPAEDLVYAALWLMLLEQRLQVPSDGTVDEALGQIELAGGWPALLKAWAKGDLSHQELLTRAKTPIEQIEAQFYVTMASARDNEQLKQELHKIAASAAIQLVEVTIARDLTAPKLSELKLPTGVKLP